MSLKCRRSFCAGRERLRIPLCSPSAAFQGEDWDRSDSDFYLTKEEETLGETVGGSVSLRDRGFERRRYGGYFLVLRNDRASGLRFWRGREVWPAALRKRMFSAGMENPSGKLADTFASCFGGLSVQQGIS